MNYILEKMDLTDLHLVFHPSTAKNIFFSSVHGVFSRKDNMLGHTMLWQILEDWKHTSLSYDYSGIKENNDMKKVGKLKSLWKLNNVLLNRQWVKEEIKREIVKYVETNRNGNITHQNLQDITKVVSRENFMVINAYIKKKKNFV